MRQIRIVEPRDAPAIAEIYAPIVRDTAISFETDPPPPEEMALRIAKTLPALPWLVMTDAQGLLGYAYASHHSERGAYRWSADVSVYVSEAARGKGVGTGLYRSLLATLERLGKRNVFAGIALPNAGSVALHESVGFKPLGVYQNVGFKLGAWRDVGWWQLRLSDDTGQPEEPTPFARLRADPRFAL